MKEVYLQIRDHVRFHHNQQIKDSNTEDKVLCFKTDTKLHKRVYSALYDEKYNRIAVGIREDGDTRQSFNGWVYTIEQFLMIDQLAS